MAADTFVYRTSARQILDAHKLLASHPGATITTGMWDDSTWTKAQLGRWFMACLQRKINRTVSDCGLRKCTNQYQSDLAHDARTIREYTVYRIRSTGSCGMLRTVDMQRRYPHINNQE